MAVSKQELGKRCMQGHRWKDAISLLKKDASENPNDPWTPMYLGSCFYELKDFATALEYYRRAEALDPDNSTPHGLQGDALLCLGRDEDARASYLTALDLSPDDSLAIKNWRRFNRIMKSRGGS